MQGEVVFLGELHPQFHTSTSHSCLHMRHDSKFRTLCGFALLLLVCLAGCSSNNLGVIEGTKWRSKEAKVGGKSLPAGTIALEFRDDGTLKYVVGSKVFDGTYSIGAQDRVVFHFKEKLADRLTHVEQVKVDEDGDQLTLIDSDGETLIFTKNSD